MEKEEFQKKYNNSILVCCTEASIKKVLNICYLMDLTASKSKQITAILIGEQTAKSPLFHVEQFLSDFYKGIEEGERKETKMFEQRMNNAIYKLKHKYGDTYIIKGTDMATLMCTTELGMNAVYKEGEDVILIEEKGSIPCVRHSARQFITDVMSGMIDVLDPFINKETTIEIKEEEDTENMISETIFHLTHTLTKLLHKVYDMERMVYSNWIRKQGKGNDRQGRFLCVPESGAPPIYMQQVGNEGQREAIQGTGFQERKQNNVHHQGQQRQHIPGKKTVGKGV